MPEVPAVPSPANMYSSQDVCAISGLSSVLVQQYADRGMLRFESVRVGDRSYRKFSYYDVVSAALMAVLRNLGISASSASGLAMGARGAMALLVDLQEAASLDWAGTQFIVIPEGGGTPVTFKRHAPLAEAMENAPDLALGTHQPDLALGKPCGFVALDLWQIIQEVNGRIAELEKSKTGR